MLRPTIPIDPGALTPATRERYDNAATLEIVPHLLAVERREKFWIVQPIQLPARAAIPLDQPRPSAQIDQPSTHASLAEEGRRSGEERMQDVAAHEGSAGEQ